jgi:flagellar FliL protein
MRDDDMSDMAAAPPSKSKMVPIMMVVVVGLVGALIFTVQKKKESTSAGSGPGESGDGKSSGALGMGPTLHLESFVVQLKSESTERFAHVTIDLELGSEEEKSRVQAALPLIRDTVIRFLIDQTVDDLRGSEGVAHLKDEVLGRLRKALPDRRISNVYVTDFIVQ